MRYVILMTVAVLTLGCELILDKDGYSWYTDTESDSDTTGGFGTTSDDVGVVRTDSDIGAGTNSGNGSDSGIGTDTDTDTDTESESGTNMGDCVATTPKSYVQCGIDGNVRWFDSCGVEGEVYSECDSCESCVNASDIVAYCLAKTAESYTQCGTGGNVRWFDSCRVEGEVYSECAAYENCVCVDISSTAAQCQAVTAESYTQCGADGNVHWFDSCENDNSIKETCVAGCETISDKEASCTCSSAWGAWDAENALCWEHPRSSAKYTWSEAVAYCAGLKTGGFTDWTLPSRKDFVDMLGGCDAEVESGGSGYCNSCESSPNCLALFGKAEDVHWSSSFVNAEDDAWAVVFSYGYVNNYGKDDNFYARCVRSRP